MRHVSDESRRCQFLERLKERYPGGVALMHLDRYEDGTFKSVFVESEYRGYLLGLVAGAAA